MSVGPGVTALSQAHAASGVPATGWDDRSAEAGVG
jgi:hypothetical protein